MRMMHGIFGDIIFSNLLCYLDDLLVFATSESEALSRLRTVFQRLSENNLKLSPKKSSQVTFIYIALLTIEIVTKHCTISK